MHDHLDQGHCRNSNVLEVRRVLLPWLCLVEGLLLSLRVVVDGIAGRINESDVVLKLCKIRSALSM